MKERRREGEGEASPSNVCSLSTRQRGRMGRHESPPRNPVHEALSPPISQAPSHVGAGEVSRRAGSQPGTEEEAEAQRGAAPRPRPAAWPQGLTVPAPVGPLGA